MREIGKPFCQDMQICGSECTPGLIKKESERTKEIQEDSKQSTAREPNESHDWDLCDKHMHQK